MTRARDLSRLLNSITTDTNNNVGIGSTTPTAKLNVVGVVSATSFNATTVSAAGSVTASSFVGNVTGTATGLSGTPNITVGVVTASSFVGNLTGTASTASFATTSFGLSGTPNITVGNIVGSGLTITGISTALDTRLQSVAEKSTIITGTNTLSLVYNSGGGNIAIHTNPSADVTLAITGIPTDTTFNNTTISFSAVLINTGTARSCTAVTLNGYSASIKWFGGSLGSAVSGVTTSTGTDIYSFTGINTVGSASTTANYLLLGNVNGSYR